MSQPFHYPFQFLIRKTQWEMDIEKQEMTELKQLIGDQEAKIIATEKRQAHWERKIQDRLTGSNGTSIAEVQRFEAYAKFYRDKKASEQAALEHLETLEKEAIERLTEKRKALRTLEKHKEKQWEKHVQETTHQEYSQEDFLNMIRQHPALGHL